MSTRATITVFDDDNYFHLYKHYDGYPEAIKPLIQEAKQSAWELPRFEAGEFSTSLIKSMKDTKWGLYLICDADIISDRRYHYDIYSSDWDLKIDVYHYQPSPEHI